jgi:hypothetical protein
VFVSGPTLGGGTTTFDATTVDVGVAPAVICVTVYVWPNALAPVSCAKNSVPPVFGRCGSAAGVPMGPGATYVGAVVLNWNW